EPTAEKAPTPEQVAFFEKSIRPVLVRECFSCHSASAEKVRGGLKLDTRDALRKGGDNGSSLDLTDPKNSRLLKAMRHDEDVKAMPPKKKLSDEIVGDFEKWITMGAPDPRDGPARVVKAEIDIEKGRKFWAFQPVQKTTVPTIKDAAWARSDIDRFLLAELEA